jgi:hypothetical protein
VVVRELERDIVDRARRSRAETFMARALECFDAGVAFVDTSQHEWRALHCSSAFTKVCLSREEKSERQVTGDNLPWSASKPASPGSNLKRDQA